MRGAAEMPQGMDFTFTGFSIDVRIDCIGPEKNTSITNRNDLIFITGEI